MKCQKEGSSPESAVTALYDRVKKELEKYKFDLAKKLNEMKTLL